MKTNTMTDMETMRPSTNITAVRGSRFWKRVRKQHILLWMSVPIMLHLALFQFVPLWGWLMAFKDYNIGQSLWEAKWVGLEHFRTLLGHDDFIKALRNNFAMNTMQLLVGTLSSIGLAVVLSELRSKTFVRIVQTMTYLPHFVSMVVVANIFVMLLSPDNGLVNELLIKWGWAEEGIFFFGKATWFWVLHTIILSWKGFGWGAIIYLAAIAGIDPSLYDAAQVDGASRWQRVKYIIIPCIMPTVILLLILSIGNLMTGGFESQFLLGNVINAEYSEVISILALRLGLNEGDFSFGTAVGIFNSVVSLTLVLIVNAIARRYQANLF
ncbi:ABC transporter permease subunit [Paenibacillus aurantius]|uniref:ABC transporter permease subunit n=1 Tax=Paenibacillus aurantius TaxID=2918900 RepID=A0AA96LFX7_9BACL|nr:ABC transporter permease subunit [Paenibacillus aurantius]WJH32174.1 ABC transporter permease subunit [Paenibacillus sp. CC-CFT747]WNQ12548.1 ABC transporter permease subunit [Paenibacillus aurantius]